MMDSTAEYRESLRAFSPTVFVNGQKIASVADEPLLQPGINAIGITYDLAADPATAPLMTAVEQETGKVVNRNLHIDRTSDDLLAKLEAVRKDQVKVNMSPRNPEFKFFEAYNIYHDPAERFPNELQTGFWAGPGITKMVQEHMRLIQKYPHREVKSHYRDFDRSFDPEPSVVYTPKKQVSW